MVVRAVTIRQTLKVRTITVCTTGSVNTRAYCVMPGSGRVKLHRMTPKNGRAYVRARNKGSGAISAIIPSFRLSSVTAAAPLPPKPKSRPDIHRAPLNNFRRTTSYRGGSAWRRFPARRNYDALDRRGSRHLPPDWQAPARAYRTSPAVVVDPERLREISSHSRGRQARLSSLTRRRAKAGPGPRYT